MSSRQSILTIVLAALMTSAAGAAFAEPDITGMWSLEDRRNQPPAPIRPDVRARDQADQKINAAHNRLIGEGHTKCLPTGMPGIMTTPFGIQFLQTKGLVTILQEVSNLPRSIHLDSKAHPPADEMLPGWLGDSIGHWEGNVLMVDTIGFNGRVNHVSTKMHMTEKFYLDGEYLVMEMTQDDPETYTAPYTTKYRFKRAAPGPASELMEYVCEVDPANLFAYEAEQKAAGKPSDFDPAWAAKAFSEPAPKETASIK